MAAHVEVAYGAVSGMLERDNIPYASRNVDRQRRGHAHDAIGSNTFHPTSPAHLYAICAQGVFVRLLRYSKNTNYTLC